MYTISWNKYTIFSYKFKYEDNWSNLIKIKSFPKRQKIYLFPLIVNTCQRPLISPPTDLLYRCT